MESLFYEVTVAENFDFNNYYFDCLKKAMKFSKKKNKQGKYVYFNSEKKVCKSLGKNEVLK